MATERSAQYLCDRVRFHAGIYDRSLLRDGFSTDRGEADRDILSALNDTVRLACMTGQFVCEFTLEVEEDVSEYTKDPDIGLIKLIAYDDVPLKRVSLIEKDDRQRYWRTQGSGNPSEYSTDMPDVIKLFPTPDTTDEVGEPSLVILAETIADDLALPSDTPSRTPAVYHEGYAYGAAILVLSSLGDQGERIANLAPVWNKYLAKMQEQAQRAEYGATDQIATFNYRKRGRG
jgi:hypothetical protein